MRAAAPRLALLLAAGLIVTALATDVTSRSTGITGASTGGCTCHASTPSSSVVPAIAGLPASWELGAEYLITVSFSGGPGEVVNPSRQNTGGFNLAASGGTLTALDGTVTVAGGEATHTSAGNNQKSWTLRWTAPSSGFGDGNIAFTLATNSVNGDGTNSGDQWNKMAVTVPGVADTTAPVITNVNAAATSTGATITWTTDDPSSSRVDYGLTSAYGSTASGANGVTSHSVSIGGLSPGNTYHYRVRSTNLAGLESASGDFTFTTVADTTPPNTFIQRPAKALYVANTEVTTLSLAGPIVIGAGLTVQGTAGDNVGVTRVDLLVDGVHHDAMRRVAGSPTNGQWQGTWDTTGYAPGEHTLALKAYDAAGNTRTSTIVRATLLRA